MPSSDGVSIPRWFMWLNGIAMTVITPAAIGAAGLLWGINNRLIILETKFDFLSEASTELSGMRSDLMSHQQVGAHQMADKRLADLEQRLGETEEKMLELQLLLRSAK